jgi:hypothetical protein
VKPAKRGRLIALDGGTAGLTAAAKDVVRTLAAAKLPSGVSHWDASGLFTDLLFQEGGVLRPSARTLMLLYAADLAFRLRWQIVPALEEGRLVVIAAPYVETAKALGVAAGLPREWLDALFRFAPRADSSYHVTQSSTRRAAAASRSFFECFSSTLQRNDCAIEPAHLKKRSLAYLTSLEKRRRVRRLNRAALTNVSSQSR